MKFGLLGHNIAYSRTPAIFEAIFEESGIVGETKIFDIAPNVFDSFTSRLKQQDLSGMSVTIPYKQRVISCMDHVDPDAAGLGAVNSIHFHDGRLKGYNTDVVGFGLPLLDIVNKLADKSVCIIGAGGAAKAAIYFLSTRLGLRSFTILGRDSEKLTIFTEEMARLVASIEIQYTQMDVDVRELNPDNICMIVNCSPLGGPNMPKSRLDWDWLRFDPGTIYYDTNYNADNRIVHEAAEAGLATIDGSTMLIGQAIESFRIWTGYEIPFGSIYNRIFGEN